MQGINGDPGTLPRVELSEVERERPFACGVRECQRRYKNIHGLRYHYQHSGDHGAVGLALMASGLQGMNSDSGTLPKVVLSGAERERELRPFACGVGECQGRYKNINGLRYHYRHSGDHGAVGLALLASGQHKCLIEPEG
jgi:transcription factor SFP1